MATVRTALVFISNAHREGKLASFVEWTKAEIGRKSPRYLFPEGYLIHVLSLRKSASILDLYDVNRLLNNLIFRNRGKEQTPPYPFEIRPWLCSARYLPKQAVALWRYGEGPFLNLKSNQQLRKHKVQQDNIGWNVSPLLKSDWCSQSYSDILWWLSSPIQN